ncbi:uncharacterized protein LOC106459242 [Limulus polyphemus]|uniref:Uncharacterized protein LOC106459242 n=1 Tax=Limulus polyphemus TaxID=6850 RepID=A0ABM1B3V8_LIMPO|nr:uncharacterized protein LOC106459242 [Limulus polyphemus]
MKLWLCVFLFSVFSSYTAATLVHIQDCGGTRVFNCSSRQSCPVQFDLDDCNNPLKCILQRGRKYNMKIDFLWGNEASQSLRVQRVMAGVITTILGSMEIDYETQDACISKKDGTKKCRKRVSFKSNTWYSSVDTFNVPHIGYAGMEIKAKYKLVSQSPAGARITLLCAMLQVKLS